MSIMCSIGTAPWWGAGGLAAVGLAAGKAGKGTLAAGLMAGVGAGAEALAGPRLLIGPISSILFMSCSLASGAFWRYVKT